MTPLEKARQEEAKICCKNCKKLVQVKGLTYCESCGKLVLALFFDCDRTNQCSDTFEFEVNKKILGIPNISNSNKN